MISVSAAFEILVANRPKLKSETVTVSEAFGRTLADNLNAKIAMPSFSASNMDGYAVPKCKKGDQLIIIGESSAGHPFEGTVGPNDAVRISTGAMIPAGADRILIRENGERIGNTLIVGASPKANEHVRAAGADFQKNDILLFSGRTLTAADLTLCAAAGQTELTTRCKPKIALLSSGDELQPVGSPLRGGQVYDANIIGLEVCLKRWGADVGVYNAIKDNPDKIIDVISQLSHFDIIVPIGGASVGVHDLMRPSFKSAGYNLLFEQVAVRPGKPIWFGRKENQCVLGFPGNPASAFIGAQIFLRELLGKKQTSIVGVLTESLAENGPRESYLRAKANVFKDQIHVTPFPHQESFRLRPQSEANAFVKVPPLGGPYEKGEQIEVILLDDAAIT